MLSVDEDKPPRLRVVDLFCGPGGISEGLRQAGCDTVFALDNDKQAVETFAANHPEATVVRDDIRNLDPSTLPECDIVVGGPPCIEFSTSKGSRGNVLDGLDLVQAYLRIIHYVKPRWWIMENVPRVTKYLPGTIPLSWIGLEEDGNMSIPVKNIFNAASYGVPQRRKRFLMGNYPTPEPTHLVNTNTETMLGASQLPIAPTLGDVLDALSVSQCQRRQIDVYVDPNYFFELASSELTDHLHETWIEDREAQRLLDLKLNHPYMGKMPFPDDLNTPARTVVATQLGRETLVIEDGGRFRRPTVREVATLQSFPLTYQFFGSPSARYRLVGDAVPPLLGFAIGKLIRQEAGHPPLANPLGASKAIRQAPPLPPLPTRTARKAQNRPDRKFARMLPGKEVRGCRAELDNRGTPTSPGEVVRWRAMLHVGEGRLRREMEVDTPVAMTALTSFSDDPEFAQGVIELLSDVDAFLDGFSVDGVALQAAWVDAHDTDGPDHLVARLNSIVDNRLPRSRWSDVRRNASALPVLKPTGIRVRVAIGLALAARVAELANLGSDAAPASLLDHWLLAVGKTVDHCGVKSKNGHLSLF